MTNEQFDDFLKDALKRRGEPADDAAAERVLMRLGTLPRQKQPYWRLPAVLLDWQFAPAWPRVAALACCAAVGFAIGLAGLDRQFRYYDQAYIAGGGGIGTLTFEPDPLTGARP